MLVLGIESSCDETAFSVVRAGRQILSNVIASQADLHEQYGGVVPELACRRHIDVCRPLLQQALADAGVSFDQIDGIAVAHGPGLMGALLIGVNFAKGLAVASSKPLVGVNHIEAHLYAPMIEHEPLLPALGVVISGGHTSLVKIEDLGTYILIGQTQDDAIGEAFDKVAKLLSLPYPGGPHIERLALQGNPDYFSLKPGKIKGHPFDFSFSGLKTAVLYKIKGQNAPKGSPLLISEEEKYHLAASFQKTAFMDLVEKARHAAKEYACSSLVVGGGVSENRYLRKLMEEEISVPIYWPPSGLSLDNAAMIAGLGYHIFRMNGDQIHNVHAHPSLPLLTAHSGELSPTA